MSLQPSVALARFYGSSDPTSCIFMTAVCAHFEPQLLNIKWDINAWIFFLSLPQSTETTVTWKCRPSLLIWSDIPATPSRSHRRSSRSTGSPHSGPPRSFSPTWTERDPPPPLISILPRRSEAYIINTAFAKGQQAPIMPLAAAGGKVPSSPAGNQRPPAVSRQRNPGWIAAPSRASTTFRKEPSTRGEWTAESDASRAISMSIDIDGLLHSFFQLFCCCNKQISRMWDKSPSINYIYIYILYVCVPLCIAITQRVHLCMKVHYI